METQARRPDPAHDAALDVVVLGGAYSGASTAILIKRWLPWARVQIVESCTRFDKKVGEATVEASTLFMLRALDLWDHLSKEHLPKHGLRFWTTDGAQRGLAELTEMGPASLPEVPSFQLDRAKLDEEILRRAVLEGCELLRPARVIDVVPAETLGQETQLTLEVGGDERHLRTRWVVDATGRHGFLARKLGVREKLSEHPTSAHWARWRGVQDLDGFGMTDPIGMDPGRLPPIACSRRLGTNHFLGQGFWTWVIPLSDGATSIGLVHDERHFNLPGSGSLRPRFEDFVRGAHGLCDLVQGAKMDQEDFHTYRHLPYCASHYMGPGWALVGDAAAFLDPLYSPGLDHCSFSVYSTARLIQEALSHALAGPTLQGAIDHHNAAFKRSYERQYRGLYRNKYEIMGDAELVSTAYNLDTSLYYLGVLRPTMRNLEEFRTPVLGSDAWQAAFAARLLRFFHERIVHHARVRQRLGIYGRRSAQWRNLEFGFHVGRGAYRPLVTGIRRLIGLELSTLMARLRRGHPAPTTTKATGKTHPV